MVAVRRFTPYRTDSLATKAMGCWTCTVHRVERSMISESDPLWRGMICLSLAVGFEQDRARLGVPAALDRLRDALAFNGLTLDTDEWMLAGVLAGELSAAELADAICSPTRIGLRGPH